MSNSDFKQKLDWDLEISSVHFFPKKERKKQNSVGLDLGVVDSGSFIVDSTALVLTLTLVCFSCEGRAHIGIVEDPS